MHHVASLISYKLYYLCFFEILHIRLLFKILLHIKVWSHCTHYTR